MAPRTLRWRLTLLYVGLLALVLAALGGYTYISLRSSLISVRASGLADDVNVGRILFNRILGTPNPVTLPTRLATTVGIASGATAGVVVWSDQKKPVGEVAPSSVLRRDLPFLDSASIQQALDGKQTDPKFITTSGGSWLVVAFPAGTHAHGLGNYAIQLSVPMKPVTDVLGLVTFLFLVGSIAALVLAFVAGLLLTGRSLRPLRRLTVTAGQLAAGDLTARTNMHRSDEVGSLAGAFDHMADRIETLFAAQQESENQVRRFIADASHELRTPITALKGYIDIMQRGAGRDPASIDSILDSMGREADRMRLLILDLLTLAQLDARREVAAAPVDIVSVVAPLLDEGVPGMPRTLIRHFPNRPVLVSGDGKALSTVVRNILVNACKYAPGAAQEWSIDTTATSAILKVADQGPGIPGRDLPHLFERFYRGEKMRAREDGGSGLGLAIVKGLVEAHRGSVRVESEEGKGTTVIIELPLASNP